MGPDVGVSSMLPCEWTDGAMLRWAIMFDWRQPGHECIAAIAQLGERQTEALKVPGSIPGLGTCCTRSVMLLVVEGRCCIQAALQLAPAVEMRLASTQKPA